jgi:anti-sigma factor RsiW
MSTAALTCREVVALIGDYLEGALPADDRARVESHLAGCENCTEYVAQMRETIRLTGMLTEERVPEEQKRALVGAFRGWRG